jgi:hypothetical protein
VLYFSLNTTLSPKTAIDYGGPKVGNIPTKTSYTWHHSVYTKYNVLHMEFEVRFVISFMRIAMTNKKWHFSWGNSRENSPRKEIPHGNFEVGI